MTLTASNEQETYDWNQQRMVSQFSETVELEAQLWHRHPYLAVNLTLTMSQVLSSGEECTGSPNLNLSFAPVCPSLVFSLPLPWCPL